jgi:N-acyl-D-aspartate/D-glutamate deacylase
MDAGQPSYVLSHWVRDEGLLDIGTAIRKISSEGAELFGIPGRGRLVPGAFGDVNVIDLAALRLLTRGWRPTSRSAPAASYSRPRATTTRRVRPPLRHRARARGRRGPW